MIDDDQHPGGESSIVTTVRGRNHRRSTMVWGVLAASVLAGVAVVAQGSGLFGASASADALQLAQADGTAPEATKPAVKKKDADKKPHRAKPEAEAPEAAAQPAPPAPQPSANAAPGGQPQPVALTQQLQAEGVRACLPKLEAAGRNSLQGAAQFNTLSAWQKSAPDGRPVSMMVGARYGQGSDVSAGMTGLFASPKGPSCDVVALQVVPSAKSCPEIAQEVVRAEGRVLGDLAGISVLQNRAGNQVSLLPTAGNGCVIMRQDIEYAP